MQVRYKFPQDDNEEHDQDGPQPHPADWQFLTGNRLIAVMFVAMLSVMLLAGVAGLNIKESLTLGLIEAFIIASIVLYPGQPV